MASTVNQPRRWRRASAHAGLVVALAATLGLTGPASSTASASAEQDCVPTGHSSARVGWGSGHGQDPNSVTPEAAARMDEALQSRVSQMVDSGALRSSGARTGTDAITIRTHVHVITRSDGTGGISPAQLRAQMRAINKGFSGRTAGSAAATPFRFRIASVDVTKKDAWYDWNLTDEGEETAEAEAAKRALHRGTRADLNVYIAGLGGGLLGYANFPQGTPLKLDGLVLLNESLPGGSAAPYNEGDTGTHEIGHWLGLYHTFENGCEAPGDYVKDTPYQDDEENIFYCGETEEFGDDTCPQPGKDPVHNFMSYGDDQCLDRFTAGQGKRMVHTWLAFRAGR
jgi:hypothetical protein